VKIDKKISVFSRQPYCNRENENFNESNPRPKSMYKTGVTGLLVPYDDRKLKLKYSYKTSKGGEGINQNVL